MAKLIENEVKGVQLKEGQTVLDVDGNEYLIEKGDVLQERNGEWGLYLETIGEELQQAILHGSLRGSVNSIEAWIKPYGLTEEEKNKVALIVAKLSKNANIVDWSSLKAHFRFTQ